LAETELLLIADWPATENLSVFPDDEVANPLARHSLHDHLDAVVWTAKSGGSHGVADHHVSDGTKMTVHRFHDVSFTDEPDDSAVRRNDRQSADVVIEKKTNRRRDFLLWAHRNDALTVDQISYVHFEPPDISRGCP